MRSKWFTSKGKRMLHVRYDGFGQDVEALKDEIDAVDEVACAEPERSLRSLIDVRDTVASSEAMAALKRSAKRTEPHAIKAAVIGVSGVRKILLDSVVRISGMNVRAFHDEAQAKEWLAED